MPKTSRRCGSRHSTIDAILHNLQTLGGPRGLGRARLGREILSGLPRGFSAVDQVRPVPRSVGTVPALSRERFGLSGEHQPKPWLPRLSLPTPSVAFFRPLSPPPKKPKSGQLPVSQKGPA